MRHTMKRTLIGIVGAIIGLTVLIAPGTASATKDRDKVTICHDGETIKVTEVEKYIHLKFHKGDYLGKCKPPPETTTTTTEPEETTTTTTFPPVVIIPDIDPCLVNPNFCPTTTPETTVPPTTEPEPADDGSDDPEPTTTVVVDTTAPPPAPTTQPPVVTQNRLPDTGNETWTMAAIAALFLAAGGSALAFTRRT